MLRAFNPIRLSVQIGNFIGILMSGCTARTRKSQPHALYSTVQALTIVVNYCTSSSMRLDHPDTVSKSCQSNRVGQAACMHRMIACNAECTYRQTDRQGITDTQSDAVFTVMIHVCIAHDSAFVVTFHVTNFMLHPNFWRMSMSCSLCHCKMAQLSRRWALLHSFGLFTLLFGLYDDGTWTSGCRRLHQTLQHLQGWHKDTSKCSQQSQLCALMQQLPKICMELACIRQLLAHVYTCDLDFVIVACMAFLALFEIVSNDWQLGMRCHSCIAGQQWLSRPGGFGPGRTPAMPGRSPPMPGRTPPVARDSFCARNRKGLHQHLIR